MGDGGILGGYFRLFMRKFSYFVAYDHCNFSVFVVCYRQQPVG